MPEPEANAQSGATPRPGADNTARPALKPVDEALAHILADAGPLGAETVALEHAAGRVLAAGLPALRTQPPFDASAMDGYAVRAADAVPGARLRRIGEAAAGRAFAGRVGPGEAVRIFTGAPVPDGADAILIQENTRPAAGDAIEATEAATAGRHIRRAGQDFRAGEIALPAGLRLDFRALALAAAMNHAHLPVTRRPKVAILSTGDELVPPGGAPGPDQIVASNHIGIAALAEAHGGEAVQLGIAGDDVDAISARVGHAVAAGADIIVTLGGASVGDHDLVAPALKAAGVSLDFWKIAMRPGKPVMFGRLGATRVLGLPGNPVSSLVVGAVLLAPLVRALAGRGEPTAVEGGRLDVALKANDMRRDYLRACIRRDEDGMAWLTPLPVQDSAMLSAFARADALLIREVFAPAAEAGAACRFIRL